MKIPQMRELQRVILGKKKKKKAALPNMLAAC